MTPNTAHSDSQSISLNVFKTVYLNTWKWFADDLFDSEDEDASSVATTTEAPSPASVDDNEMHNGFTVIQVSILFYWIRIQKARPFFHCKKSYFQSFYKFSLILDFDIDSKAMRSVNSYGSSAKTP